MPYHLKKILSPVWISAAALLACAGGGSIADVPQTSLDGEPGGPDASVQMGDQPTAGPSDPSGEPSTDAGTGTAAPSTDAGTGTAVPSADGDAGANPQDAANPEGNFVLGCEIGEPSAREACGSMLSPATGVEIQFGPRGAAVEVNVGGGAFSTTSDTAFSALICPVFASSFGEDPDLLDRVLDTTDVDLSLFTVYRPAHMQPDETFPVISWGNGTCAQPEGYGPLLRHLASHGFIVVAANSRFVGDGSEMVMGLDLIESLNKDSGSPIFGRADMSRVGIMGHSQGSSGARAAANDPRAKAVILWNGGSAHSKPYLAVSAELDLGDVTAEGMAGALQAPGAFIFFHDPYGMGGIRGHLTLMLEPERVTGLSLNFWRMTLLDDPAATAWFAGNDCTLCAPGNVPELKSYDFGSAGF